MSFCFVISCMCLKNLYIHTQLIDNHTKAASKQNREIMCIWKYVLIMSNGKIWLRELYYSPSPLKIAHCNSLRSTSIAHSTSLLSRQFKLNFVIHVTHSAKYFVICFLNKINMGLNWQCNYTFPALGCVIMP